MNIEMPSLATSNTTEESEKAELDYHTGPLIASLSL